MSNVAFISNSADNAGTPLGDLEPGTAFLFAIGESLTELHASVSVRESGVDYCEVFCFRDGTVEKESLGTIVFPTPIEIHHARKPRA